MSAPTLVIGATPTSGAAVALHAGTTFAAMLGETHLVVTHVSPDPQDSDVHATMSRWLHAETGTDDGPTIECLTGEPALVLLTSAASHNAMLIAVGTHTNTHAWPRHRLGHTLSTLLHLAERPVMICPPPASPPPANYRRVLVGFDDTPASHAALTFARRLADQINGTVHAVTVVDFEPLTESALAAQHQIQAAENLALEQLNAAVASTSGQTQITTSTRYGRPHTKLLELTDDADLLIVGNKGRGPIARAVVGSTLRGCLLHTTKPVIAVPQTNATAKPK